MTRQIFFSFEQILFNMKVCFLFLAVVLVINRTDSFRIKRFAGGRDAEKGEIKYQVQLRLVKEKKEEGYSCTGALLSREIVVTTVGCVYDREK